jgi:hypothetical protein
MHPKISRVTFEQHLADLNSKKIFEPLIDEKVISGFVDCIFGKKSKKDKVQEDMLLLVLNERFRDISIVREKSNEEESLIYLALIKAYKLIYSPSSDILSANINEAWRDSTKKSIREDLLTQFKQALKIATRYKSPQLVVEQLILIRGTKLKNLFKDTDLAEALELTILAARRKPLLSTNRELNTLCQNNPLFLNDPLCYKKWQEEQSQESELFDYPCRRDFSPSQVVLNGIPVASLIAQELAYTRQSFVTYAAADVLPDRIVWDNLSISSSEDKLDPKYLQSIKLDDFDRTTFRNDVNQTDKLEPFIKKYLFGEIESPILQEKLYKHFVTHFHQTGIATYYLTMGYHRFSDNGFGDKFIFPFETYSCTAKNNGYSLSAICHIKSIDKRTFATMKGEFLITLEDLINPNFKNYAVKLAQVDLQVHINITSTTDPSINSLIKSLKEYQWYLNALVFMNNLKENPRNQVAQALNLIKEDFLTLKDNPYIGNHLYTWIPEIEHIIAKAISDYVTRPASFNLVDSLFDPLSERESVCKPKKTLFQFSTDPSQSNILAFWRQVETCSLAFKSESIITSCPQR